MRQRTKLEHDTKEFKIEAIELAHQQNSDIGNPEIESKCRGLRVWCIAFIRGWLESNFNVPENVKSIEDHVLAG